MKYFWTILSLSLLIFEMSCNKKTNYVKKNISLAGYERAETDTSNGYIELTMLNIYPAEHSCNDSEVYANLFIAKQLNGNVIYVFEPCSKVDNYLFDTTGRYVPIIDTQQILHSQLKKVIVYVPKDFSMPKGVKYLVSKVTDISEK